MLSIGLLAAFGTLLFFTMEDSLSKAISNKFGNYLSSLLIVGFGVIPLAATFLIFPTAPISGQLLALGIFTGVLLAGGYVLVYMSLETEQVSNIWAMLNLSPAAVVILGAFVLAELISALQAVCIILIFIGIFMVTITRRAKINTKLIPAMIGNVLWAAFVVIVVYGITYFHGSYANLFFISRVVATAVLLVYGIHALKLRKREYVESIKKHGILVKGIVLAAAAGITSGIGQIMVTLYTVYGFVVFGAAISAIEPAFIAVIGYLAYKDRLTKLQASGIIISIIAATALSFI